MIDAKLPLRLLFLARAEAFTLRQVRIVNGRHERPIGAPHPELALLVEFGQYPAVLLLDEIEDVLVVLEFDHIPIDALAHVLLLLQLEHEPIELLLEGFVAVIYTQLLEGVRLEGFEPEYVEQSDERPPPALVVVCDDNGLLVRYRRRSPGDAGIDATDEKGENGVEILRENFEILKL